MATIKQKKAFTFFVENRGSDKPLPFGQILLGAGYSIAQAKNPKQVLESKGWQELADEHMPDDKLATKHAKLLDTKYIEHMVFPLDMTDDEITELVESVGGTVRKFKHSETQTHVWFWSDNPKAQLDALKLAYDIKGKLNKRSGDGEPSPVTNNYNTFVQQNNINPNSPTAQELVQHTLKSLMEQTKWKPQPVEGETVDKQ